MLQDSVSKYHDGWNVYSLPVRLVLWPFHCCQFIFICLRFRWACMRIIQIECRCFVDCEYVELTMIGGIRVDFSISRALRIRSIDSLLAVEMKIFPVDFRWLSDDIDTAAFNIDQSHWPFSIDRREKPNKDWKKIIIATQGKKKTREKSCEMWILKLELWISNKNLFRLFSNLQFPLSYLLFTWRFRLCLPIT